MFTVCTDTVAYTLIPHSSGVVEWAWPRPVSALLRWSLVPMLPGLFSEPSPFCEYPSVVCTIEMAQ